MKIENYLKVIIGLLAVRVLQSSYCLYKANEEANYLDGVDFSDEFEES